MEIETRQLEEKTNHVSNFVRFLPHDSPEVPGHDLNDGGVVAQCHVLAVHHLLSCFPAVLERAAQPPVHLERDAALGFLLVKSELIVL